MSTPSTEILWFCRTGDSSSLSRITDSVIPHLTTSFNITLLSNKTSLKNVRNVIMGADTNTITYKEFMQDQIVTKETIRCLNMKYLVVQIVDLIYSGNFKYLVLCNGVYEIDWMTKMLTNDPKYLTNQHGVRTKIIVWSPIDYIPTFPVVQNIIRADLFLTMTPVMMTEIQKCIISAHIPSIAWVGHGSDINTDMSSNTTSIYDKLNRLRLTKQIVCKQSIKPSDIIILNANNYGPLVDLSCVDNTPGTRKRLDITVKAFLKLLETRKDVKLWIHTNLKSFFDMLSIENISLSSFADNVILSNNTLSSEQLGMIYSVSQITLQTSTGEGWSLTNLESAMYDSLQVVPDFLACGWHFSENRGILIPVTRKTIKNEGDIDVIIGEVSVDDTYNKLLEALELLCHKEDLNKVLASSKEYAKSYTWASVAERLINLLDLI